MRRAILALVLFATLPGTAFGASADVIRDCQDGKIDGSFSSREFSDALRNIPTDVDEYTDCRDVIRRAQLGSAGGKANSAEAAGVPGAATPPPAGGGSSAASILEAASPAEQAAVTKATQQAGAPVVVGGETISPDASGLSPAGAANVVPTPLVVALVLLGLGLFAGGFTSLRTLALSRRTPAT